METLDSAHMRVLNSSVLLKMIWCEREISRADISQRTGMSRSTVSTIVSELIDRGLVTETGTGQSNGGRRPVILSFNEDAYCVLGIDFGRRHIRVALTNLRGCVRYWCYENYAVEDQPDVCIDHLFEVIDRVKKLCLADSKPLLGIGLALPGWDESGNEMVDVNPHWNQAHLESLLKEKIKLPLAFESDLNLGALAELWWRQPKGQSNLAYISARSGIAAGLIIGGRIHRGSHGRAGDLGLLQMFQTQGQAAFLSSSLQDALRQECVGDADDAVSRYLAYLSTQVLRFLDLDAIVFDESLVKMKDRRLLQLQARCEQSLWGTPSSAARLDACMLGERQIAVGAATMILAQALDDFSLFPRVANSNFQWSRNQHAVLST